MNDFLATVEWASLDAASRRATLERPTALASSDITADVRAILAAVRERGDQALLAFSQQFDGVELSNVRVTAAEMRAAEASLSSEVIEAIDDAMANVRRFHEAQAPAAIEVETVDGVVCQRVVRPIDRVGLYVPAGSAPLPSTALMLAVPAQIAGCPVRVLCTPPNAQGAADPTVLAVAARAGIDAVFKVGGAQAIAAMAYGTESVSQVDRIFGPGNAWVTTAKTLVAAEIGGPAIDLPAGPSEVMVIADGDANAEFVAADLLAQAEHDRLSQVLLVTDSDALISRTRSAITRQLDDRQRRSIIEQCLVNSAAIRVESLSTAIDICNDYAPEHLILNCADAARRVDDVRNAGSIFVGAWTPESLGDYCSGTNHVLPTYGAARALGGLGVGHFCRLMTVQTASRGGLQRLARTTETLANLEGLDAHAYAVSVRLEDEVA
ncbi:MAG: histidinol dehydrogenase [Pseudomonadota bacterium]